jgi:general L-amino acid transport system substrate-binding protein
MKSSTNPEILRVLGLEEGSTLAADLGLENNWVENIITSVGNYGEVFERNIGQDSPLKIARGLNALWTKGGILYAPPIR